MDTDTLSRWATIPGRVVSCVLAVAVATGPVSADPWAPLALWQAANPGFVVVAPPVGLVPVEAEEARLCIVGPENLTSLLGWNFVSNSIVAKVLEKFALQHV